MRSSITSGLSSPRRRRRCSNSSQLGGRMKISTAFGNSCLICKRALPVDFEHHVLAALQMRSSMALREVPYGGHAPRPIRKNRRACTIAAKCRLVDEKVLATVLLLAARRAGGVRHRGREVRVELQQRLHQAGLARPAGGRDDEQVSGKVHGLQSLCHSMFCTCSRICSIVTFISTRCASSPVPRTWSPGYWLRAAVPGSGNPAACRSRRPAARRRSISSRCEPKRASSSATSMRMA